LRRKEKHEGCFEGGVGMNPHTLEAENQWLHIMKNVIYTVSRTPYEETEIICYEGEKE